MPIQTSVVLLVTGVPFLLRACVAIALPLYMLALDQLITERLLNILFFLLYLETPFALVPSEE
jgi:hypothetical protein